MLNIAEVEGVQAIPVLSKHCQLCAGLRASSQQSSCSLGSERKGSTGLLPLPPMNMQCSWEDRVLLNTYREL